jgi:hypothetical protein
MSFITRELYQAQQGSDDPKGASKRWHEACESYRNYLKGIEAQLPPRVREFSDITWHDGVARAVLRPTPSKLVLEIDARNNPWGPIGVFRVQFLDVREVEGTDNLLGDEWLYEETHLHPHGFEFSVLFWRSDLRVVAGDVEFEEIEAQKHG